MGASGHNVGRVITTGGVRAIGLVAGLAAIAWLPIGGLIFLGNVTFAASDDGFLPVAGFVYLMAAFTFIGAVAGRAYSRPASWLAACAVAGIVMAVLVNATFATVDNLFLSTVSQQPEKIADFHTSGMTSMRDFVNLTLERQVIGITILLVLMGLLLGTVGAVCAVDARRQRLDNSLRL
jgi:hypothetical protein